MSLLQRPPIDVNAAIGCERALDLTVYAADRMLDAAMGLRPFAGAVIRNAISNPFLHELQEMPPEELNATLGQLRLANAVDDAVRERWDESPLDRRLNQGPFQFERTLTQAEGRKDTIDQKLDPKTGFPMAGPLLGLLAIKGERIDIKLAVRRKYPFNTKAKSTFDGSPLPEPQVVHFIHFEPGDLVLATNIMPTIRSFKPIGSDSCLLAGFTSRLRAA